MREEMRVSVEALVVELYELIALDDCNPATCLCGAVASSHTSWICFFLNVSAADKGLRFVLLFLFFCFWSSLMKREDAHWRTGGRSCRRFKKKKKKIEKRNYDYKQRLYAILYFRCLSMNSTEEKSILYFFHMFHSAFATHTKARKHFQKAADAK